MIDRYRAIIIKNDEIVLMERHKKGRHFFVFPGGHRENGETKEECCKREILEECGIEVEVKQMIYEITQNKMPQGFFVCEWKSGVIHKTDAEEYTSFKEEIYGTFNPTTKKLTEIEKLAILPTEVKKQLLSDLKLYGEELKRPLKKILCKDMD